MSNGDLRMTFEELTNSIIKASGDDYTKLNQIMLRMLSLITLAFPDVVSEGVKEANRYWHGQGNGRECLVNHRIQTWYYLDQNYSSTETTNPFVCGIRAAISVMYPDHESDDIRQFVDFFTRMLRRSMDGISDDKFFVETQKILKEIDHDSH